jgi:hypothetical protein
MTTIEDVMALSDETAAAAAREGFMPGGFEDARTALRAAIEQYAAERVAEMQAEFDRTCLDLQDYAERLTAEITRLTEINRNLCIKSNTYVIENARLQEDADRYRWLRDMDEDPVCSLAAMWTDCKGSARSISKRVDAAVDAHRGKNTT